MDFYFERIKPLFDSSPLTDVDLEKAIKLPAKSIYKWGAGHSTSYTKYIHEIADYFGVSPAYLRGETDDKSPPAVESGIELSEEERQLIDIFRDGPEGLKEAFRMMMAGAKAQKNHPQDK